MPVINEYEKTTTLSAADEFLVWQDGAVKNITAGNLLSGLGVESSVAELNYAKNVSGDIQTQLDGKQATVTGAGSSIMTANLTPDVVVVSDANGKISISPVTAEEVGYLSGVTGAVQNQIDSKQEQLVYSVVKYGAVGNGTADDTTAIQDCIDAVEAAGGGIVFFPVGIYKVTATLVVDTSGVLLLGAGMGRTFIRRSTDFGDTILFTGTAPTEIQSVGISDLTIQCTTTEVTSGAAVAMVGVIRSVINNVTILDGFIGFKFASCRATFVSNTYIVFATDAIIPASGTRYAVFTEDTSFSGHPSCGDLFVNNFNWRGSASAFAEYGIYITSSDGIWFDNGHVGNTTVSNIVFVPAVAHTESIDLVFFNNVMSDKCSGNGITFSGGDATYFTKNVQFTGCSVKGGSTGLIGISAPTNTYAYSIQFSNCFISEFTQEGVKLVSDTIGQWSFSNCQVRGNSYGSTGSYDGISITGGDKISFVGGCSGGGSQLPSATLSQRYGLFVANTNTPTEIIISGVDLKGNNTGSMSIADAVRPEVYLNGILIDNITTVSSAATLTLPPFGQHFTVNGTTGITTITANRTVFSTPVTLRFTTSLTVSDGNNLKLAGDFSAGADDTLTLICDGTNWYEVARSAN
jgi:hypothetical protein